MRHLAIPCKIVTIRTNASDSPPMTPPRRIAHLDMDAFFASVELLQYPELRGLPVVVGGRSTMAPIVNADGSRSFARLGGADDSRFTTRSYHRRSLVSGPHSTCARERASLSP